MSSGLLQFTVILMLLMVGFMFMAHSMFGTSMTSFSTLGACFVTMFEVLTGSSSENYFSLAEADPIAAPIFFFPFVFIMLFVTLNVAIAITMGMQSIVSPWMYVYKHGFSFVPALWRLLARRKEHCLRALLLCVSSCSRTTELACREHEPTLA